VIPPEVSAALHHPTVRAALTRTLGAHAAAVVALDGAPWPSEVLPPPEALPGGLRAVGVDLAVAVDLATARAASAAAELGAEPPAGRGWVLALGRGRGCATLAHPRAV